MYIYHIIFILFNHASTNSTFAQISGPPFVRSEHIPQAVTVRARVARVWEFYKDNELAHVDLVFVDEQVYDKIDWHP